MSWQMTFFIVSFIIFLMFFLLFAALAAGRSSGPMIKTNWWLVLVGCFVAAGGMTMIAMGLVSLGDLFGAVL